MASGETHDKLTWAGAIALSVAVIPHGIPTAATLGLSALVGGLWLSPDLDMANTRPYKRWLFLSWYWWLYQDRLSHRSIISHSPILGTFFRLLYLLPGLWVAFTLAGEDLIMFVELLLKDPERTRLALLAIAGIEFSSILHLIADSRLWRRLFSHEPNKKPKQG